MFGKSFSAYVAFLRPVLIAMVGVGVARLALSATGIDGAARLASTTAVTLFGIVYCGLRVQSTGFGGFKQLYALMLVQSVVYNLISAAGVVAAAVGIPNLYAAAEFSNMPNYVPHILGHVVGGLTIVPIATWILASLVLVLARAAGVRQRATA